MKQVVMPKTYWGTGHVIQIREFYDYLLGEKEFLVSGEEALKIQKIVSGIYQSSKLNRPINL